MTGADARPIVLVTGAAGNLGRSVAAALSGSFQVVGFDIKAGDSNTEIGFAVFEVDFTADASVELALRSVMALGAVCWCSGRCVQATSSAASSSGGTPCGGR